METAVGRALSLRTLASIQLLDDPIDPPSFHRDREVVRLRSCQSPVVREQEQTLPDQLDLVTWLQAKES